MILDRVGTAVATEVDKTLVVNNVSVEQATFRIFKFPTLCTDGSRQVEALFQRVTLILKGSKSTGSPTSYCLRKAVAWPRIL